MLLRGIGQSTWYYLLPTFSTIPGIDELNSIAVASFREIPVYPLRYDDKLPW
jgi:hypothetical protein